MTSTPRSLGHFGGDLSAVTLVSARSALSSLTFQALISTGRAVHHYARLPSADRGACPPSAHVVLLGEQPIPSGGMHSARLRWAAPRWRRDALMAVEAAYHCGATTVVAISSIFVGNVKRGDIRAHSWSRARPEVAAAVAVEAAADRFTALGGNAVVIRLGWPYGAGDPTTHRIIEGAAKGWQFLDGPPEALIPTVELHDGASGIAAALQLPAGSYDLTDGCPRTQGELAAAITDGTGRALHPLFDPQWGNGRLFGHSWPADHLPFRLATDWAPRHPDAAQHLFDLCRVRQHGPGNPSS